MLPNRHRSYSTNLGKKICITLLLLYQIKVNSKSSALLIWGEIKRGCCYGFFSPRDPGASRNIYQPIALTRRQTFLSTSLKKLLEYRVHTQNSWLMLVPRLSFLSHCLYGIFVTYYKEILSFTCYLSTCARHYFRHLGHISEKTKITIPLWVWINP